MQAGRLTIFVDPASNSVQHEFDRWVVRLMDLVRHGALHREIMYFAHSLSRRGSPRCARSNQFWPISLCMLAERKFLPRLGRPSAERRPSASLRLGPPPFDEASKRAVPAKADIDATA